MERHGVFRIKIDQRHLDLTTVPRVDGSRRIEHSHTLLDGKTGPWMHQSHVTRWKGDRHSCRHQCPLERLQRDFLRSAQISASVTGMGIIQFRRMVRIQRLYQNLDVFRFVICFVERHQAAHS